MNKSVKLERLEKKLNTATKLLESLDEIDDELGLDKEIQEVESLPVVVPAAGSNLPAVVDDEFIFTMTQLKQDYTMVRQNVISLVAKGQRILDQVSILELSELKASQIEAMSTLQSTIGTNLKLLIEIYKMISDIEKQRQKGQGGFDSAINMGTVTNNNIVFTGTPSQLLDIIKDNSGNN